MCTSQAFNSCRAAPMLLGMAEGCHAVVQAFVQKLAVCLLEVDRDPSSPMEEEMNNWTAEATCFVSFFTRVACPRVSVLYTPAHHCVAWHHQSGIASESGSSVWWGPLLQKQHIALHIAPHTLLEALSSAIVADSVLQVSGSRASIA